MKNISLLLLLAAPLSVSAQPGDSLETFVGVWSGVFTTQDHEFWNVEDLNCFVGCGRDGYEYLASLLDDPANDERSVNELMGEAAAFETESFAARLTPLAKMIQQENTLENDPKMHCQPYGFVREVTNPLPFRLRRLGDHLLFEYEEWSLLRTVYMDGRDHPQYQSPSLLGHSVGRVENGTLVIETARVTPDRISDGTQAGHSDQLTGVERYTVHNNPRRLELEFTVKDPVTFTQPFVITKTWLATPDLELLQDSCGDLPGVY
jgi:hypothetical protein